MNDLIKNRKYLWLFILIGAIVYFPIFKNGFVWDDFPFIIQNSQVHQINIPTLLGPNMFNSGPFYRPIPAVYFAAVYSLFKENAFYYHLLQLILHLIGTYLLFLFLRRFFKNGLAVFLAIIFLVHPINVESVAYIGSTQSQLYFIPGIIALLLSSKHHLSRRRILLITLFLFIAAITKETGFLFIPLCLALRFIYKLNGLKQLILSSTLIVILYFFIRLLIGGVGYKMSETIPIAGLSFPERILNIPAVITYYLQTFIFPLNLAIWQFWTVKSITLENYIFPLLISGFFFILYKNETKHQADIRNQFLFFTIWFTIGIGLLLQLIPLDMTVADRWFYFPIVGLLGLIGAGLQIIQRSLKINKKLIIFIAIVIIGLLSVRTINRNFDWKDYLTLCRHDLKINTRNFMFLDQCAITAYRNGLLDEALKYDKLAVNIAPTVSNLNHLGVFYYKNKQYSRAIPVLERAIQAYNALPGDQLKAPPGMRPAVDRQLESAVLQLVLTYNQLNRRQDSVKLINEVGLKKFSSSPEMRGLLKETESKLNN